MKFNPLIIQHGSTPDRTGRLDATVKQRTRDLELVKISSKSLIVVCLLSLRDEFNTF